uniref:PDZ domain-containing protein n=1 Tax=Panagrolaimus sp. ES5 TaxID=591445 RepID=A0AC34F8B3_9BILA
MSKIVVPQSTSSSSSSNESEQIKPAKSEATTPSTASTRCEVRRTSSSASSAPKSHNSATSAPKSLVEDLDPLEVEARKSKYKSVDILIEMRNGKSSNIDLVPRRIGKTLIFTFVPSKGSIYNHFLKNTDDVVAIDGQPITSEAHANLLSTKACGKASFYIKISRLGTI